jgi:uncharacterized protein
MNYIEAVRTIASRYLEDPNQSVSHRADHIERVLFTARRLAQECFDVDEEILTLAVLLHDINQPYNDKKNHVQLSEQRANDILGAVEYPEERRRLVLQIIREHSTEQLEKASSVEAAILFDADKIDGVGPIGVARVFARFGQSGRPPLEAINWYKEKISIAQEHLHTFEGKRIFAERVRFTLDFLVELTKASRNIAL